MNVRSLLLVHVCATVLWHCNGLLYADGGKVQLSQQQGDYRITVFTAPTPLRVGPVDISVFVQDVATGAPVPHAQVTLRATPKKGTVPLLPRHERASRGTALQSRPDGSGEPSHVSNLRAEVINRGTVPFFGTPRGQAGETVCHPATAAATTNKLYQAAVFDLPKPGWWDVEIVIERLGAPIKVSFAVEAAKPLPGFWAMAPWIAWPALIIVLFCIHQGLVRRKQREARSK